MKRRNFLQALAIPATVPARRLEAIAAARLPLSIAAPAQATGAIVEIRRYGVMPDPASLRGAAIDFVLLDRFTLLANFRSLEERDASWSLFAALQRHYSEVTSIAVFRNSNC